MPNFAEARNSWFGSVRPSMHQSLVISLRRTGSAIAILLALLLPYNHVLARTIPTHLFTKLLLKPLSIDKQTLAQATLGDRRRCNQSSWCTFKPSPPKWTWGSLTSDMPYCWTPAGSLLWLRLCVHMTAVYRYLGITGTMPSLVHLGVLFLRVSVDRNVEQHRAHGKNVDTLSLTPVIMISARRDTAYSNFKRFERTGTGERGMPCFSVNHYN